MIGRNEWEMIKKEVVIDWFEVYTHGLFGGSEENSDHLIYGLDIQRTLHRDYSYNERQQDALFPSFILVKNSSCFGQTYCPSSGDLILYLQQLL